MSDCCCERHSRVNSGKPCRHCVVHGVEANPKTKDVATLRAMAERWDEESTGADTTMGDELRALADFMEGYKR